MKFRRGIGTRMVMITMLPVMFLFSSFVWYSWYSHCAQVAEELAERGRILAKALAETSEYNVISGNLSDLRLTINGLVQSDRSIHRIDVVDANQQPAVSVASDRSADAEPRYYEAPIRKQMIWINLFSDNGAPHVSGSSDTKPPTLTTETVGWVRVTMSPSHMLDKQARRFRLELAMAALALIISIALALALARKVAERTSELVESRNEALKADADKRKLIQKVNSIIEDERKSIAVEIHDELNASLIAARLQSQSIFHLADKAGEGPAIDEIKAKSQAITKLTLDLYASGRRLVRRLRPEVLDMLGLHGAVEEMIRHYDSSHGGSRFEFRSEGDFSQLGNELAISAYRIVQEALSNVMKHATATRTRVSLVLDDEEGMLHIEVSDNGAGFDMATSSSGIGIIGMRERVYALGGTISFASEPGSGTIISISLPLDVS
ncbi:sensor histidine kinase [Massilia sp. GCM10020059]|uniref:Oxygen sensor histidine kinase NreB n=1 Tax=Massilia agrisoli TaxID=2892444 RepID=A0ABS8IX65_9BURK|nr:sensor histidine kinase [Massilia agrisoli]MCC6072556.1 sensor histidine kinase [Massilia agrisoli]